MALFICLQRAQVDISEKTFMSQHIFHCTDQFFFNSAADTFPHDPNILKKLNRGDSIWETQK